MLKPRPTYKEFRQRIKAVAILKTRLRKGFIERPSQCEECKKTNKIIYAHHPDYSKPYKIMWLCPKCHGKKRQDKAV